MSRIIIIGGHGKVALRLARRQTAAYHQVAAWIRNPNHAEEVRQAGADPVVFDVEHANTDAMAERLRGYDAVVWSAGAGGGNPARTYAVDRDAAIRSMDAARAAEVNRYIMVSYLGASLEHSVPKDDAFFPYAQAKAEADEHLRRSGLGWTILRPGLLTDTHGTGRIQLDPDPAAATRDTARENVARVVAAVLETPATAGLTLSFTDGDVDIGAALQSAIHRSSTP